MDGGASKESRKTSAEQTGGRAKGSSSLAERIYLVIRAKIEEGSMRPGETLMEAQVVKAFGVSRSPARQALEQLLGEGLIESRSGRGYSIAGTAEPQHLGRPAVLEDVRVSVPRQWERMYAEVEKQINIQMLFGSVQVNENELASHFEVSRTVTRDVLARMHSVGLVAKGRYGHWVAERLSAERVGNLFEMREILEPQALLRAAPHLPRPELVAAQHNVEVARARKTIDSAEYDRTETDLHILLLEHCPNGELLLALKRTHLLFAPTRHLGDPFLGVPVEIIRAALDEHAEILESLASGRTDRAMEQLVAHIRVAHSRWNRRLTIASQVLDLRMPPYLTKIAE